MAKNTICFGCGAEKFSENGYLVCKSSLCLYSIEVNVTRNNTRLYNKPTTKHRNNKPLF